MLNYIIIIIITIIIILFLYRLNSKDNSKNNWLENRGYKMLTIWESEWRKFPDDTLDKCLKFLST